MASRKTVEPWTQAARRNSLSSPAPSSARVSSIAGAMRSSAGGAPADRSTRARASSSLSFTSAGVVRPATRLMFRPALVTACNKRRRAMSASE